MPSASSASFASCLSVICINIFLSVCDAVSIGQCNAAKTCETGFEKAVFATTRPMFDREMTQLLFPTIADQGDDNQTCGLGSKFIFLDTCSQIHQPWTPYHPTFQMKVSKAQETLTQKWDHLLNPSNSWRYDSFLDNSVAFFVDDLAFYYNTWKRLEADVVALIWYSDVDKSEETPYYSIITHNRDGTDSTLSQFELISDTFTFADVDNVFLDASGGLDMLRTESRAYFDESTDYRQLLDDGCEILPLGMRRAVSDVERNVAWYVELLTVSATTGDNYDVPAVVRGEAKDYNGQLVKYAHIKLESRYNRSASVSFFERIGTKSSHGDLRVFEWESGMNIAHSEAMTSPMCGLDRWFDLHYALNLQNAKHAQLVVQKLAKSGLKYTIFAAPQSTPKAFAYVPEPNGQSLQLIFKTDGIEWKVEPTGWAEDWCPMECTDEQASYSFGDAIFDFDEDYLFLSDVEVEQNDDDQERREWNDDVQERKWGQWVQERKGELEMVGAVFIVVVLLVATKICMSCWCSSGAYEETCTKRQSQSASAITPLLTDEARLKRVAVC